MKTIQTIIATTILLASVNASAGVFNNTGSSTSRTESGTYITVVAGSKAQAYQLGKDALSELQSISHQQLAARVGLHSGGANLDTFHMNDGAFITVQERLSSSGKLEYVGIVNLKVSYLEEIEND